MIKNSTVIYLALVTATCCCGHQKPKETDSLCNNRKNSTRTSNSQNLTLDPATLKAEIKQYPEQWRIFKDDTLLNFRNMHTKYVTPMQEMHKYQVMLNKESHLALCLAFYKNRRNIKLTSREQGNVNKACTDFLNKVDAAYETATWYKEWWDWICCLPVEQEK